MKAKTFWYFTKEAGNNLVRNGLMALAALGTITIALLISGSFYILISNFSHFGTMAKDVIEVKVFLKDGVEDYPHIYNLLSEIDGVRKVRFVSRSEGAKNLERLLGNRKDLFFNEDENPLPDGFEVKLKESADVKAVVEEIQQLPGVQEVFYGKTFVEAMLILARISVVVGVVLIVLMVFAVLYIVVNTIQLTVYARRKEIEIMKLVGATDWFIRWPFLLEGVMLGIVGATVSILILSKTYHFLFAKLRMVTPFIPMVAEVKINNGLMLILLAGGIVFGATGSLLSVKRYLRI